jgi:hypothetical protein
MPAACRVSKLVTRGLTVAARALLVLQTMMMVLKGTAQSQTCCWQWLLANPMP